MSLVLVEHPRPGVALITLNRPERMNSMAFDVMVPLKEALEKVTYDNSVRVVVLTGAGRGFSSGADHKSAGAVPHVDGLTRPTYALRSMEMLDDVILALRRLHQPVIAAVNGAAIGGGLCLALAADIRVASTGAYFRAAGINNGLTASELGLSYLLPGPSGRRGRSRSCSPAATSPPRKPSASGWCRARCPTSSCWTPAMRSPRASPRSRGRASN